MLIGLIDADLQWGKHAPGRRYGNQKADVFPNLALMKISAWHKAQGDDVEWYNALTYYDIVYVAKVFSTTPISREYIHARVVYFGGSGFSIRLIDGREYWSDDLANCGALMSPEGKIGSWQYMPKLYSYMEHIYPDYSLYPNIDDTAYGFLSRGCPRRCPFCHVAPKEGTNSHKVANLDEWWRGQKNIVLMDPNILACPDKYDLLDQLALSGAMVDINQGLDARLINERTMEYLNRIKLKSIHFAWDRLADEEQVLRGIDLFNSRYCHKIEKSHHVQVYVLTNYDTTIEQDLERIKKLTDRNCEPYVMIYDKEHCSTRHKSLQRWCNNRAIFHKVPDFKYYSPKLAKE